MIINGQLIDIKPYDTKKGPVVNLYIQESPPSRVVFHAATWKEEAEIVKAKINIGDTITLSCYATGIDNERQITVEGVKIIEVKRSVVVTDQIVLLNDNKQSEIDETKAGDHCD